MLRRETVALPGGRQQVVYRGGAADGPPLLWLHALSGVEQDDPLLVALARSHDVVAPLAPGFDDLAELDDLRDVHDLALHYDDLLETLGLDRVPVVGHSFGGMIAAELAAHVPKRVERLVLIAPLGLWNPEHEVVDLFAVPYKELPQLLYRDPANDPYREQETRAPRGGLDPTGNPDTVDVESLVRLAQGMTSLAKFLFPIPDRGVARRLRRVTAPALVVFGADDAFVPAAYADDWVALLADARKVVVAEAGHMVTRERPEQVVEAVEAFVEAPAARTGN